MQTVKQRLPAIMVCLLLIMILLPFCAEASEVMNAPKGIDGDLPVITVEKQKVEYLPRAQLLDTPSGEKAAQQKVIENGVSFIFPYEGVHGSKWFKGRKMVIPFYEYSRGSANGSDEETIYIYLLDSTGKILVGYEGAFETEEGAYSWNIEIKNSDQFMPGLYQLVFYSTYHPGNLESGAWPMHIERRLPNNIGNTVQVDEAKANKSIALGYTSIDFTLVSNGYARQQYHVELCDAGKNVITSAEGEFDMKPGTYPCKLELSDTLRPGTYYMRAYTLDFPKLGEYVRFTVDNRGIGWELDEQKGILTIFGKGEIPSYHRGEAPWQGKMPDIWENLKTVIIEPGITGIGGWTFYGYSGLEKLSLPEGFRTIGRETFVCTGLRTLALPNSVSSIGNQAFERCANLTEVTTFGGGHTNRGAVESRAFEACPKLTKVMIPASINALDSNIFNKHGRLPMTVRFQDEAVSFWYDSFSGITAKVYYPSNLDSWTANKRKQYGGSITWTGYEVPLARVLMTGVNPHKTGNIVYWSASTGADLYQVFRLRSGQTQWTLLCNTRGTAYKDTTAEPGVNYLYKIRARNGQRMSSMDIAGLWAKRPYPLDSVTMTEAVGAVNGIAVYWEAVEGAKLYQVFRLRSGETQWTLVGTTGATGYKDATAEHEVKYYYKVRAKNGELVSSLDIVSVFGERLCLLEKPHIGETWGSKEGNWFTWKGRTNSDVTYEVLRRLPNDSRFVVLAVTKDNEYLDTTAEPGVRYCYIVRAKKGELASSIKYGWVGIRRGFPLDNVYMTKAIGHATGNIIYWEAVENAKLYQVYRLRSGESSWTLLKNTGVLAYKDTSAESGVKYYYKVVARNGNDRSSMDITSVSAIRP